jgi:hypothetical protein
MMRPKLLAGLVLAVAGAAAAGDAAAPNQWVKVDEGKTGERLGSVLLYAPDQIGRAHV